jgi:hypothetical protein
MYNCSYCKYKSNKKYNLDRHINTKHKNNIIENNNDIVQNKNNDIIENNNDIVQNKNNDIIENKCYKCNKILSSKQNLKKHLLICKGVSNPLECHLCHKIYYDSSSKSKHLKKCKGVLTELGNNIIEENKNSEYIYLLQEREFIKTNEPIYKIGKTKQECLKRIINYPNGTKLIIQIECNDCDTYEKLLITKFKKDFIHKNDIGNEYFYGNRFKMINIIYNLLWEMNIKNRIN